MSDLPHLHERLARLRRLGLHKGAAHLQPRPETPPSEKLGRGIEQVVAGQERQTPLGDCFVAEETYAMTYHHGDLPLAAALQVPPPTLARLADCSEPAGFDLRRAVFFDIETSGLSGGTGTYAFLVGAGFFQGDAFCVQQFFMRDVTEEAAMLYLVGDLLDRFDVAVSFNGRAFDLPLLNTRFTLARQPRRLTRAPHLDLLKPARRLWARRLDSCSLGSLERQVLGVARAEADVPGWLVPRLYFDYIQTSDASELGGVFYHNLIDILSMVTLAARLGALFGDPLTAEPLDAVDLFSLGWWYASLSMVAEAEAAYRAALAQPLPVEIESAVWRNLSLLLKRQERRPEAAVIWRQVIEKGETWGEFAHVELAKYYEWHTGDLAAAADVTRQAIALLQNAPPDRRIEETLAELTHRLRRLARKINSTPAQE